MKIIKFLITISIINAIALIGLISFGTKPIANPKSSTEIVASPKPSVNIVATTTAPVATKAPIRKPMATKTPVSATPKPSTPIGNSAPAPLVVATPIPKVIVATPTPTPTSTPVANPGCVILIDGVKYDVTQFRNKHSGGNVFQCGTDMSAVFWSRHNASILGMMAQYKI